MRPAMSALRVRAAATAALALVLGVAACSGKRATEPAVTVEPAPTPNSPTNALVLFQWCWVHQSVDRYREVLPADFVFQFALLDTAGNSFRNGEWGREQELAGFEALCVRGNQAYPHASKITLDFTSPLVDFPDSRPGKAPRWHHEIRADVLLRVDAGASQYQVQGQANFFLVRGDSAQIPAELAARGFTPDSTRWWIERWEDETAAVPAPPAGARPAEPRAPLPTADFTWGLIKRIYLPPTAMP